uniref:Uncharacterized protein n=1 Tax=Megaviridae environmental sample TaxID=1737588 RepID=A0A5J6VKN2_9VIRU|nr:MAG: hypothetical protein [Megaviridae environmental sample]
MNHPNWNINSKNLFKKQESTLVDNEKSYKNQFKLSKFKNEPTVELNTLYKDVNSGHTLNVVKPEHFNMEKYKKNSSGYRDSTLNLKDYHSKEVGLYARKKQDPHRLFKVTDKKSSLVSGYDYMNRMENTKHRRGKTFTKFNNQIPKNLYLEKPITSKDVRIKPKDLNEIRGSGIHSQRLSPHNRTQKTGKKAEGVSTNPEDIFLTKFKKKTWREQKPEDLGATTGAYLKPTYHGKIKLPTTARTVSREVVGHAANLNSVQEYRNKQKANPTIKESTVKNEHILGPFNQLGVSNRNNQKAKETIKESTIVNRHVLGPVNTNITSMRNNQKANTTIKQTTSKNEHITGNFNNIGLYAKNNQQTNNTIRQQTEVNSSLIGPYSNTAPISHNNQASNKTLREHFGTDGMISGSTQVPSRNNQTANNTIRQQTVLNSQILNTKGYDMVSSRNNQNANTTIRQQNETNTYILNTKGNDMSTSRNYQNANPTIREQSELNSHILNNKGHDMSTSRNNQNANITIREQTTNNEHITNAKGYDMNTSRNNQNANKTIREQSELNSHILNSKGHDMNTIRNNQNANPTIREQSELNSHILNSRGHDMNTIRNNQNANKTIREQTTDNEHVLNPKGYDMNTSRNNQHANKTIREQSELNSHILNSKGYDMSTSRNHQNANTTIREQSETNSHILNSKGYDMNTSRNNQIANRTIREQMSNNEHVLNPKGNDMNTSRNNQNANKTIREQMSNNEHILNPKGNDMNTTRNNQSANKTIRETTEMNEATGNPLLSMTYAVNDDPIKPKNIVMAHNYKGISSSNTQEHTSRMFKENFESDDRTEKSIDLRKIELSGGKDQVSATKQHLGEFKSNTKIDPNNIKMLGPASEISQGYIVYDSFVKGKTHNNERQKIDNRILENLDGNPYVNNIVHKSTSDKDNLRHGSNAWKNTRNIVELKASN